MDNKRQKCLFFGCFSYRLLKHQLKIVLKSKLQNKKKEFLVFEFMKSFNKFRHLVLPDLQLNCCEAAIKFYSIKKPLRVKL